MDAQDTRVLNPVPAIVWVFVMAIAGVELAFQAGAAGVFGEQALGWRIAAIERWSFSAAIQNWMIQNHHVPWYHLARSLTFGFIHASATHALFGAIIVAALGKAVVDRMGRWAFMVLVLPVPACAAAVYGVVMGNDSRAWLVGALPAGFALVGAFTWHRWHNATTARDRRRAFAMIGVLMTARLAFGLFVEAAPVWIAELAAFALGFALAALVLGPGRWSRTREKIKG